ncbi:MAG: 2-oxoglutarate dehydrogenase complex dihydrolipoyllysine-residue succinyltransferase [Gammaproteobacteria bacterium]|nr:2-oxoglutarate dehydrogenase complex dihydrolipoyllysine-residue succinyltransferase [Gammaproteobacteria bacterium]
MTIEIKVPGLPESVTDATIAKWYKKVGDTIARDENLVDLETDKVMLEVPAPRAGVIEQIIAVEGSIVKAGELLAIIREADVAATPAAAPAPTAKPVEAPATAKPAATQTVSTVSVANTNTLDATLTPSERRAVRAGVALPASAAISTSSREEKRVPMSRLRQRVAERLLQVQSEAAILTTFNEINMKPVMDLRNKYKDEFEKKTGSRLGFMSFFTKAVVEALKEFPAVNASIDGTDILYHNYFDIGVAIGSERGLVVPVIRNADQISMAAIEKQIRDYAKKAGDGKIAMEDLMGGTFTITNAGTYGSMMSTPIINPPQSAILGMHNIIERPIAENGQIVIRPMMYVALSYDHRIIDGREAVLFLMSVKKFIEDPARFMLQI